MNGIFFEWASHEERAAAALNLPSTINAQFSPDRFDIEKVNSVDFVSIFVDSRISNTELDILKTKGVSRILLRSAGYNMLDVEYAKSLGIAVSRVASYSPESIAEHVFALMLSVVRKVMVDRRKHIANNNGREDAQIGFTLKGKTLGLYGLGKIAQQVAFIAKNGFGMEIVFYDPFVKEFDERYRRVDTLDELFMESRIVSVHTLLNDTTKNSINYKILELSKDLVLINTARGGILNLADAVRALDDGHVSGLGLDVAGDDDQYITVPLRDDIVFTQHTAFFTEEAISSIIEQTFENITNPRPENVL